MIEMYKNVVSTIICGLANRNEPGEDSGTDWRLVIMPITLFAFAITLLAMNYTYGEVVKTLTIIESPTAILFEPIPMEDLDPLEFKPDDEPSIETQQLITRKLRTTIAHLQSRAGRRSYFRGLSIYIFCDILFILLVGMMHALPFIPYVVSAFIATVLLSNFRMGWTWMVISEPSNKLWFRRLPSMKLWTTIAIPTALAAIFEVVAKATPIYAVFLFDLVNGDITKDGGGWQLLTILKVLTVVGIYVFCAVVAIIPSRVMLTRVQASLLPETEETIVPFDRSFGGKFAPAISRSNAIGLLVAWRTFDWNSRVRLFKLYLKVAAMQVALVILCLVVLGAEVMILSYTRD